VYSPIRSGSAAGDTLNTLAIWRRGSRLKES
jgi:hypothetical protein